MAAVHHVLGLLLVRQGRSDEAMDHLAQAVSLDPQTPRFSYVYGVALNSTGRTGDALSALEAAHGRSPFDFDLLFALATINRDRGTFDAALGYARKLGALRPSDSSVRQLVSQLEAVAAATR